MRPIASNDRNQALGPHPEEAGLFARPSRRMAAGTISLVAVLRDARNRNRLLPISILLYVPKSGRPDFGCALLRTRLMDDVEIVGCDWFHGVDLLPPGSRGLIAAAGAWCSR